MHNGKGPRVISSIWLFKYCSIIYVRGHLSTIELWWYFHGKSGDYICAIVFLIYLFCALNYLQQFYIAFLTIALWVFKYGTVSLPTLCFLKITLTTHWVDNLKLVHKYICQNWQKGNEIDEILNLSQWIRNLPTQQPAWQ